MKRKSKNPKSNLVKQIVFAVSCVVILVYAITFFNSDSKDLPKRELLTIKDTLSFQDSLLTKIFNLRMEHPYIVYSQAIIESGNFNSVVFRENNNLFGMKIPERRPTLAIGINRGHAVFNSWRDCLIDYALYQSAFMRGLTEDEYFSRLNQIYAEDTDYEKKLRIIKTTYKKSLQL